MLSARAVGARGGEGGLAVDAMPIDEADGSPLPVVNGAVIAANGFGNGVPHETDDIIDILDVGLGSLGGLMGLSASAKEFTPGGGGETPSLPPQGADCGSQEPWEGEGGSGAWLGGWEEGGGMYAEVQLEAEVLEVMAETFSDCSPEALQVALAKSGWDLDRASTAIFCALQACDYALRPAKPCRHLLAGECRRSDCAFSHDFASTTCRYWLQGQCVNYDACHFLHDVDVSDEAVGLPAVNDDDGGGGLQEVEANEAATKHREVDRDNSSSGTVGILEADEFPSLEPGPSTLLSLKPSDLKPSVSSSSSRIAAGRCKKHTGSVGGTAIDSRAAGEPSVTAAAKTTIIAAELGDAGQLVPIHIQAKAARKDEDVLLAAVVGTSRKGGGVKKGGKGRKTRFSPVNIQALMRASAENTSPEVSTRRNASPPPSKPALGDGGAESGTSNNNDTSGVDSIGRTKAACFGLSFADVVASAKAAPVGGKMNGVPGPVTGWSGRGGRGLESGVSGRGGIAAGYGAVPGWVSTGDAVALQYQQARQEAGELARARNKLFTSATEAFRRGEGMVARDLARRGRELNERMKEKHREAASEIFTSRNPGDQVFAQKSMDLHGLHVSEAVEVLDRELAILVDRGAESVRVLAGTGHHSKGPTSKARLIPAVENFCASRGLAFRSVPDQGTGHVGVVDVNLAGLLSVEQGGYAVCAGGGGTGVSWEGAGGRMFSGSYQQRPTR